MALYGTIWHYMALYGTIWHYMALYGTIWHYIALYGTILHYMALYGTIWHYMALYGTIWHYIENSHCKWLWTSRKIDCRLNFVPAAAVIPWKRLNVFGSGNCIVLV